MVKGSALFVIYTTYLLWTSTASGSYEDFRRAHGRDAVGDGSVSFDVRQQLFAQRKAEAVAHNSLNRSWTMAVNHFSDYTDEELQRMLGYKRVGGRWSQGSSVASGGSSFLQADEYEDDVENEVVAAEVDWRQNLQKSSTWVRNQGGCGSCWAVAAAGALEMHNERRGIAKRLAVQQIIDCVPNPRHCGGDGGCKGATGELAFEYARIYGVMAEDGYNGTCSGALPSAVKVAQFVRLPDNQVKYLHHAVATKGPVVVSVDGGNWFSYGGGVFSGCQKDTVVNHAVLAVGYGHDSSSGKDYWLVRNSWGGSWGENGYLRIERHMQDRAYCGIDNNPKDGVYCDNAPSQIEVCGMCGITSDSAYPVIPSYRNSLRHAKNNLKGTRLGGLFVGREAQSGFAF
jgi:cathepsin L|mmetsp:Transcript_28112/g.44642  ORF Transcript_28112/g.44642 Transcript_28112/m.44642 type:complete len:399 (-) Transcript_28112:248-1444(-)